jgi:flagellar hook-associated protein 3 FlgL
MRVTQNSTYRLMETNLQRITTKLQDLQNQGATGLKLNSPSDDPAAIGPVISTRTQITNTSRYITTMGTTSDQMQSTDTYLGNIQTILDSAQQIAVHAINGGLSNSDLNSLADQIDQLKQQLLDTSNASINGKYIFAGYEENTKPFTENPTYDPLTYDPTDSTTWPVLYNGDANQTELEITPGETVETNITGNQLFMGISNANWQDSATPATGQPEAGKVDIFAALTRTEEAIRANNVDDPAGAGGGIQANITALHTAADQADSLRSKLGIQATRVDNATQQQQSVKTDLQQILSHYQDADAISTFADITQQQTAFQAALNITAQVSKISILDYL